MGHATRVLKLLKDPKTVEDILSRLLVPSKNHLQFKDYRRIPLHKNPEPEFLDDLDSDEPVELYGPWPVPQENFIKIEGVSDEPQENYKYQRDMFLTGGAVAAVIFEKIYGRPAQINDIDFFFYDFEGKDSKQIVESIYSNLDDEDFDYKIVKSEEEGLLNFIEIIPGFNFTWTSLLDSFDLTYAQVGVVLAENRLVYTKGFLRWLITKVIMLTPKGESEEFPLTTFIRAQQKTTELDSKFYLNDACRHHVWNYKEHLIVNKTLSKEIVHSRKDCDSAFDEVVSEKRLRYWQAHPRLLLPWYSLGKENTVNYHIPEEPWVNFVTNFRIPQEALSQGPELDRLILQRKSFLSELPPYIVNKPKIFFARLTKVLHSQIVREEKFWANLLTKKPESVNLFENDISSQDLNSLQNFTALHTPLRKRVEKLIKGSDFKLSLLQVIELFKYLKKQTPYVIGFFEEFSLEKQNRFYRDEDSHYVAEQNQWKNMAVHHLFSNQYEQFFRCLSKIESIEKKINSLVEPINITPFKALVKELNTSPDLAEEGKKMKHCVAGYADKVKSGRSRIFHIEIGDKVSTLEMVPEIKQIKLPVTVHKAYKPSPERQQEVNRLRDKRRFQKQILTYKIVQHKAKSNQEPAEINKKVAVRLSAFINQNVHLIKSR